MLERIKNIIRPIYIAVKSILPPPRKYAPKRLLKADPMASTKAYLLGRNKSTVPYSYASFCQQLMEVDRAQNLLYADMDFMQTPKCRFDIKPGILEGKKSFFIRHDVDHDPFIALKMAEVEAEFAIKSTYYILTSDSKFAKYYWKKDKERSLEALRKINDLGHEIGLHYDFYGDFFLKGIDPRRNAKETLELLREAGIEIKGCASHGSGRMRRMLKKAGHEHFPNEYINYTIWKDVIKDISELKLNRRVIKTGQLSLSEFGLKYEAYFVKRNHYASDAGGYIWLHNNEPIEMLKNKVKENEILTILVHPVWWRNYLR